VAQAGLHCVKMNFYKKDTVITGGSLIHHVAQVLREAERRLLKRLKTAVLTACSVNERSSGGYILKGLSRNFYKMIIVWTV
jgi:hypothetical protein